MTNLEKMNELVNTTATKEQIKGWAYNNRIHVSDLHFENEFSTMQNSIESFTRSDSFDILGDEHKNWDNFLDSEFIA